MEPFAVNIKFLVDVTVHSREEGQAVMDKIVNWYDSHGMTLSLKKQ